MGIRQSFDRITIQQFEHLRQEPALETLRDILAANHSDESFFFSPLDEPRSFEQVRSLTLEKSYWELLEQNATTQLPDDPLPSWPITEDASPTISPMLSDIHFLDPAAVQSFAHTITAFSRERLARRYSIDLQHQDALDDEEKDWIFEAMVGCVEDLTRLVQQAAANNEVILWSIG
jgi:hypothetical protein